MAGYLANRNLNQISGTSLFPASANLYGTGNKAVSSVAEKVTVDEVRTAEAIYRLDSIRKGQPTVLVYGGIYA